MVFYTDSHKEMAEKYVISRAELAGFQRENVFWWQATQRCKTAKYGESGFVDSMLDKLVALQEIPVGEKWLYVDADVILCRGLHDAVDEMELQRDQICCQWDDGQLCLGVVLFQQTAFTRDWWRFLRYYASMMDMIDQSAMHRLLLDAKRVMVKFGALPFPAFGNWSHIRTDKKLWDGQDFDLPDDIKLWHANFTLGLSNKYKMLSMVERKIVDATKALA